MLRSIARLATAAAVMALAAPAAANAAAFGSNSIWSAPLRSDAPLASNSAQLGAGIAAQVAGTMPWINTTQYSAPVYTVSGSQKRVKVTLDKYCPPLMQDLASVPMPDNAVPAAGSDKHLILMQPSTNTMWEFWGLSKQADGWHTRWGGKMASLSAHAGFFPDHLGASASSLPLIGGLMRTSELAAKSINHAIDVGLPDVTAGTYAWPAQRTDGLSTAATAVPEGTRFRLPANLNLDQFGMNPTIRAIAVAVQKYGMIVRDRTYSAVTLYAEDPTPTGANPYKQIFGAGYFNQMLAKFPWAQLQAVAASPSVFNSLVPATVASEVPSPAAAAPKGTSKPNTSIPVTTTPVKATAPAKMIAPAKTTPTRSTSPSKTSSPSGSNSGGGNSSASTDGGSLVGAAPAAAAPAKAKAKANAKAKRSKGFTKCVAKARKAKSKRARTARRAACARAARHLK